MALRARTLGARACKRTCVPDFLSTPSGISISVEVVKEALEACTCVPDFFFTPLQRTSISVDTVKEAFALGVRIFGAFAYRRTCMAGL
jgi:hypothetical protein